MCLQVRVFYQCGCDVLPTQGYETWSCHGYTPDCYRTPNAILCFYMLANDCGRPTCQSVRNYWSWQVHVGLCGQELWRLFVQSYGTWCAAGGNNQPPPIYVDHPQAVLPYRWFPGYPRYDRPGFRFIVFEDSFPRFKAENPMPPPWPVLDVPLQHVQNHDQSHPPLDKRKFEEEEQLEGPQRLTIEQVHLHFFYRKASVGDVTFRFSVPDRRWNPTLFGVTSDNNQV
ncbi:hypothetical protein QBC32DRAFT_258256 [Pseudoneurospora amorphoporcata]|uniref:Uncharacterized protein n=1 Tax=Pseudoneurospora amorphoporcata TaxID=241081 RepID=A0AAN6NWH3_9PEZI|nr:hypothetical protein QBC32DRAFT_258256 [Pseudoneurospora amorphoporcata]